MGGGFNFLEVKVAAKAAGSSSSGGRIKRCAQGGGLLWNVIFGCGVVQGGKSKILVRTSELCAKNFVIPFDYHNHS
jgi:hypothetical protein